MSDRIANIIVLGEDQEHQSLVAKYLVRAGHNPRLVRLEPLPGNRGSGSQYVREKFPEQVTKCRSIVGKKTKCLLIVITDADNFSTIEREQTLHRELASAGHSALTQADPVVILVPKWQVETWVKCLLGQTVAENDGRSDEPPVDSQQIKMAAEVLYGWTRKNATQEPQCVPSLREALPRWHRLG